MNRIIVSGISGAGKTTLARKLSERLGLPRHELDALHHGPGWVKRPEFESDVDGFSRGGRWVSEDQYHRALGDLLWERADTVVWLDLPRRTVMWRVVRRSVARAVSGRELWNGNREAWRDWLEPDHPVRWAWRHHGRRRRETAARAERHPDVRVIRLRTAREARNWLKQELKRQREQKREAGQPAPPAPRNPAQAAYAARGPGSGPGPGPETTISCDPSPPPPPPPSPVTSVSFGPEPSPGPGPLTTILGPVPSPPPVPVMTTVPVSAGSVVSACAAAVPARPRIGKASTVTARPNCLRMVGNSSPGAGCPFTGEACRPVPAVTA
ncbi:hypothetical protein [Nonomuraea rhizosphaerae]|uniref:hypothetical protein n=1 Tax=Nonomuraea rhizosphaerae TaxID=2665663 RepID=UPI001C5E34E6|nr:hypothetical protein [Nonomuraea rhizosphaerae]